MNYLCSQEIAQDLLLNCNYHKHELASEIGIRVIQLDDVLSGKQIKEKVSLSSRLIKISNRHKQYNNEYNTHTTRSGMNIFKDEEEKRD